MDRFMKCYSTAKLFKYSLILKFKVKLFVSFHLPFILLFCMSPSEQQLKIITRNNYIGIRIHRMSKERSNKHMNNAKQFPCLNFLYEIVFIIFAFFQFLCESNKKCF